MPGFTGSTGGSGPAMSIGGPMQSKDPFYKSPNFWSGAGGLAGGLWSMFGPQQTNPGAEGLQNYINQGQQAAQKYGDLSGKLTSNLPQLQQTFSSLVTDPSEFLKQWGGGYKESPGYQFKLGQGQQAAANAAAAGGMAGSPQHQQFSAQIANDIANQDYENYLNRIQSLFGTGLSGQHNLFNTGFGGYGNLAQMGVGAADALARLKASQEDKTGGGIGELIGGLSNLAAFI